MTMPRLTELQLAALACVRDHEVVPISEHLGWRTILVYRARPQVLARLSPKHRRGFNVTCQIRSFQKRRLIQFRERLGAGALFDLSPTGIAVLDQHPEF